MISATMTSKGQLTVPKEVRDALRLEPGTKVQFEVTQSGEVTMRPKTWDTKRLKGIVKVPVGKRVSIEDMKETIAEGWTRKGRGNV